MSGSDAALSKRSVLLTGVHLPDFLGPNEKLIRQLETEHPAVSFHLRDYLLTLEGSQEAVAAAERVILELLEIARLRAQPGSRDVAHLSRLGAAAGEGRKLAEPILTVRGRAIRPQTAGQREYVRAIEEHAVTFGTGPAGTGKTYLAVALAVRALQRREVSKIVLTRPAVEAGERLGYLPGSLEEKIDPYLRPLFDALTTMLDAETVPRLLETGTVEVAPLAYMRGRTLNESFIILDEAQNTTPEQMKMFLTRLGFDSHMVITGDSSQVDLPSKRSGLAHAQQVLQGVEGIGFARLTSDDVVRNELVSRIVDAYGVGE
ncbi:PhoH family protein [Canibacter zhoujuaniae]|uniref:PhoH family protein n=1 Tax=Canibacter zhoujuaniae TaxID=2708343 RepID=UPI001AB02D2B